MKEMKDLKDRGKVSVCLTRPATSPTGSLAREPI